MKRFIVLLLLITTSLVAQNKVLIITHVHNRSDFIPLQYETFKKFLKDDYEYVVFNDAPNQALEEQINTTCARYGIRCIRVPQEIHTRPYLYREPNDWLQQNNFRHANGVQYSLDVLGFDHDGILLFIDNDCLLIRPFSIIEYMKDKDISALVHRPRQKAYYCSPLICLLNLPHLPEKRTLSFNCGPLNGVPGDSGAWTYHYLMKHPEVKLVPVTMLFSHQLFLEDKHINKPADNATSEESKVSFYERVGFNQTEVNFLLKKPDTFEFYLNNLFLHYRGATYTHGDAYKYKIFTEFINEILKS